MPTELELDRPAGLKPSAVAKSAGHGSEGDIGHFVTIDGHAVFFKDPIGDGKGFTRAALHAKLLEHHNAVSGGEYSGANDEWSSAGRGQLQTTFYEKLPGEVKHYLEGNPSARHFFRVTQDAAAAGGADAMGDLGEDKYFAHIDRLTGSKINAAVHTAEHSDDPNMQYLAKIHQNMPDDEAAKLRGQSTRLKNEAHAARKQSDEATDPLLKQKHAARAERISAQADDVKADAAKAKGRDIGIIHKGQLNVGDSFTFAGEKHRVVDLGGNHLVLQGDSDQFPIEALENVVADRGSYRTKSKSKGKGHPSVLPAAGEGDDVAPFSRDSDLVYILSDGEATPESEDLIELDQRPATRNGMPVSYYWRQSIQDGEWTHPVKKFTISVTPESRRGLEANFRKMRAAGEEPPVVTDHLDHKASATVGWVVDMRQRGEWLEELHQYMGEDAKTMALRNKISVGIDPHYRDSRQNEYGPAIVHSAITSRPVIPGQGEAVLEASATGAEAATGIIYLTRAEPPSPSQASYAMTTMPQCISACKSCISACNTAANATSGQLHATIATCLAECRKCLATMEGGSNSDCARCADECDRCEAACAGNSGAVASCAKACESCGTKCREMAKSPMSRGSPNKSTPNVSAASSAAAAPATTSTPAAPPQRSTMSATLDMARKLCCGDETLAALHKHVPGLEDAPDDEKLARIAQHLHTIAAADEDDAGGPDAIAKMSRSEIIDAAVATRATRKANESRLAAENTHLQTQMQELGRKVVKPLDPENEAAIIDALKTKLDNATARGGINPATRDRLFGILGKSKAGTVNTLALSRPANPTGSTALALAIADALNDNRPVPVGESTQLQTLARAVPGETVSEEHRQANEAKAMMDKHLAAA